MIFTSVLSCCVNRQFRKGDMFSPLMLRSLLCVLCLCFSTQSSAADDKAFFWQVTAGKSSVYLLGSIHFADESFYPLRTAITDAFERSDSLVVELDINKSGDDAYRRLVLERGVFKDGRTIEDVISEETYLQLRQRLRNLDVSYDAIKSYRPGVLVLTLTAVQVMQMGFDASYGIDVYFLTLAAKQSPPKKIIELESMEQQLQLFLNIPNGDLLLKETLYSLDESALMMTDMVHFWKEGNEARMNKMLFDDALEAYPAFGDIYDRLFYERNQHMTDRIVDMLKQGGTYFVVVGTGHLIGNKGIIQRLKDAGYQPERR